MERFLGHYPIQSIDIDNEKYPTRLKKTPSAPKTIFFRGNLEFNQERCFAVVGTRLCSGYGKEIALSFSISLSAAGLTIVSGMALGIDTWAHKGTIEANGRAVAVLGTGLDERSIYPQENLKLAKQILEKGGCLISEYSSGTPGSKFTFPKRNRIIAGISLGILVVEAKMKSGALITADYARKYSRKIFAVPGNILSQNSKGCHFLIKRGAQLVESANDILDEFDIKPPSRQNTALNVNENEVEKAILQALQMGSQTIDKIIELTNLPAPQISSAISLMELDSKVKNLGGNVYALRR
ncbi:MAG: DNA-processing protein DprA [Candidatus Pacebacteria bacterium]|nr:DNA-processing protein DprA [Candidatus Paceibacterota bacterium]